MTARQAAFGTPLNPFFNDTDEEKLHNDYTVPQRKYITKLIGNTIKMPKIG